jgi:hypothetical protein
MAGPTCYVVVALGSSGPLAYSDALCGIPGASTLGAAGAGAALPDGRR